MSRTIGSYGPRTFEAIMKAGLELIYEHGYEAVSLRRLARAVGIQSGSLYNHINSKQELLAGLVVTHLRDLLEAADDALSEIEDPEAALRAFIAFHLTYHVSRKREIYIANSELRSLEPENRRRAVELRHKYEGKLIGILEDLTDRSHFRLREPRLTAYAILTMLTGVAAWYRADGRLPLETLIELHTDLVFNGLTGSERRSPTNLANSPSRDCAPKGAHNRLFGPRVG